MSSPAIVASASGGDMALTPESVQFPIGVSDAPILQQAKAGGVTLNDILKHENFLTQFIVSPNAHVGAVLWSQQVGPQQLVSTITHNQDLQRRPTRVSLIASMYQSWCGNLKFQFRFTKTILQQCKMVACFIPGLRAGQVPPSPQLLVDYQYSIVINPANESVGILEVPFISDTNWLSVNDYTGRIIVGMISPLVASEQVHSDLPVMVTVTAEELKFRSLIAPATLLPDGGGGGGGGGEGGGSNPAEVFAESCSRVPETGKPSRAYTGYLFAMDNDASSSEYAYALPITRRQVLSAVDGIDGFSMRLALMRPTNECSPVHAVLAPQASMLNAAPAFRKFSPTTGDSGLSLDSQLALVPCFLPYVGTGGAPGIDGREMRMYFRVDSTREMPLPLYKGTLPILTGWRSDNSAYTSWDVIDITKYVPNGTTQQWIRIRVARTNVITEGVWRWQLDGVFAPQQGFIERLRTELRTWATGVDEYDSIMLYCTGPILLHDSLRSHLLEGVANASSSITVSFTSSQGARIFQGDRLGGKNRFLFKFFYKLFGGNPNSPWAKVCAVADRICTLGLSLLVNYDGTPAPIPLTPETRMSITTEETDLAEYPKQYVTVPTSTALEYQSKIELFFSKSEKRRVKRREKRTRKRAAKARGEQVSTTEASSVDSDN